MADVGIKHITHNTKTMLITSFGNPKIKEVVKLKKAGQRREHDLILIEGRREITLAMGSGIKIEELFCCEELLKGDKLKNIEQEKIISVTEEVFKKISYREHPDGLLALAEPAFKKLVDIKLPTNPLIIILEAVEKPGNLGAILRTADAAGVDAIIINDLKTDIYNPNVIRASQGTVFTGKVVISKTEETIKWLKKNKIKSLATTPAAEKNYSEADYKKGTAIIMGAEDKGLSEVWMDVADEKIKIKMRGKIDSLNVSVATAVIIFEALRQRSG